MTRCTFNWETVPESEVHSTSTLDVLGAPGDAGLEARLTLANGFLGVPGASPIRGSALQRCKQRSWVAGLFDRGSEAAGAPALASVPDQMVLSAWIDGVPLPGAAVEARGLRRTLCMERGWLATSWQPRGTHAIHRLRSLHLVSIADRRLELLLVRFELVADAEITLEARWILAPSPLLADQRTSELSVWRARHASRGLARATEATLRIDDCELVPSTPDAFMRRWSWRAAAGQRVFFQQVSSYSRADSPDMDPAPSAQEGLRVARGAGWEGILSLHEREWAERWLASDVEVAGDDAAQRALRFAAYHLIGAANPDDPHVSIGARGLTGERYFGHVLWDTEAFLLPFYILTWPQAARSLLSYRYSTLNGARRKATRLGWRGAFYAWESADSGEETAPDHVSGPEGGSLQVLSGRNEAHISADVAWAVWRYWRATQDDAFFVERGGEILFETARFWASRAESGSDGRTHIRCVEGPDEYHQSVNDNAFTNVMARWNLLRALDTAALFQERWPQQWTAIATRLSLSAPEFALWKRVADTLALGLSEGSALYEQFSGFFELEHIDLKRYAGRAQPMDVVLGPERTRRSQVIKQADVVQLQALLPELFDTRSGLENFRFYEPRCAHGSSLSMVTHALVAARLGDTKLALDYFHRAAAIDLGDETGRSEGGVHLATLGGLWQAAVMGFAGLTLLDDTPAFDPHLPAAWKSLAFPIQWRGRRLAIRIDGDLFTATLEAGETLTLSVAGCVHELHQRRPLHVQLGTRAIR